MSNRQLVGRVGCVVAWASLVEMLLTWPVWVPEGLALNTIFCSGQSIPTSSPPPLVAGPLQGQAAGGGQAGSHADLWGASSQVKSMPPPQAPVFSSKSPRWRILVMSHFLNWVLITQVCTVCENPSNYTPACSHFSVCRLHFQKQLKEKNLAGEHKDPQVPDCFLHPIPIS